MMASTMTGISTLTVARSARYPKSKPGPNADLNLSPSVETSASSLALPVVYELKTLGLFSSLYASGCVF